MPIGIQVPPRPQIETHIQDPSLKEEMPVLCIAPESTRFLLLTSVTSDQKWSFAIISGVQSSSLHFPALSSKVSRQPFHSTNPLPQTKKSQASCYFVTISKTNVQTHNFYQFHPSRYSKLRSTMPRTLTRTILIHFVFHW